MTGKKAKSYLVTGGAGFIGSFLCEALVAKEKNVVCVDNLSTGSMDNLSNILGEKKITFVKADVANQNDYSKFSNFPYDFILHLASPAGPNPESPKSYHQMPVATYLVNSFGTHLLCQLARKKGATFLFASSSEVYGDPKVHPQKEDYFGNVNPLSSRAVYDESKRLGETITSCMGRKFGLKTRIARIFNTYGPRMNIDDGRALPLFVYKTLKKEPITVFGTGRQTRSFCYIDDLIKGLLKILECPAANNQAVNFGNPQEITILELLQEIKKTVGYLPEICYRSLPEGDPKRRRPDISKAQKILGWSPKVTLKEGLKKTIAYFVKKNPARRHLRGEKSKGVLIILKTPNINKVFLVP